MLSLTRVLARVGRSLMFGVLNYFGLRPRAAASPGPQNLPEADAPTSNRSAKLIGDAAENASAAALLAGVLSDGERGAPRNAAHTLDVYPNGAGRPSDWQRVTVRTLKWSSADRSATNFASRSISRRYAALRPPWRLRQVDELSNWVEGKR